MTRKTPTKDDLRVKLHIVKSPVIPHVKIPTHELEVRRASEIEDRPQTWLWKDFIPYETCTLIAGVPGIGKSQFLMWLTAMVSNGSQFKLNGMNFKIEPGSVLILACEDSPETGITPRLKALNANLDKIHLLRCAVPVEETRNRRLVGLDSDIDLIEDQIKEIGDVKLLIVDPISGFSGKTRDHIDAEVRNLLNKLNELADKYKIAIVLNKHLRKQKGEGFAAAINEVAGSGAWVAVVRQSFIIAPYHEDESLILFSNLKVNLNRKNKEAFAYRIQSKNYINQKGEAIETSCMEWTNEKILISADDVLNKNGYEDKGKLQIAKEFLEEYLEKNGQSLVFRIQEAAKKSDIAIPTLYRAKDLLNIKSSKGISGKQMWQIEG